ncbi:mannose-6-phosphate isomerase, class I [Virgibacillus proomii]|uniref:mannose-6-phosphate isomerase, class I n=1 Tax=Virgibacillus proomii TaxID=84407 RepID=UPI001C127013|nr:mannose-6-phosphate isomerase, class I [Virgibacillus proomii]MBU5266997.1 mannose-6-phosphate isomerase, class I [Virgibacillus proomii]
MNQEPIFLKPVFQERIWGGKKLKALFGYEIPSEQTGEAWVISAHPHGPSEIINGPLAGKTLQDAWENHGELFHKKSSDDEAYPLLVKILDANDNLSVQVHPDDKFARNVENQPYGKTECWYVLDAEPGAEIILGHHAKTKEDLAAMMDNGDWDQLLQRVAVNKGDFIYVPSGTIHAIGKGIVILETQQSSDITYRVYDYDRKDKKGNPRELHLDKAKQVTNIPHQMSKLEQQSYQKEGLNVQQLVKETYFTVYHWKLSGEVTQHLEADFLQCSVITGNAEIHVNNKSYTLKKGNNFILPYGIDTYQLVGNAELIVSHT